jgi:hypothetical protein
MHLKIIYFVFVSFTPPLRYKPEGLIPSKVIGFFNLPNPSSRTMALGSNQPLTEMRTRSLPGGKRRPACKADNLAAICEPIISKMWEPRRLTTLWASVACYRDSFTLCVPFNNDASSSC